VREKRKAIEGEKWREGRRERRERNGGDKDT
jgi:hypothetical protein